MVCDNLKPAFRKVTKRTRLYFCVLMYFDNAILDCRTTKVQIILKYAIINLL